MDAVGDSVLSSEAESKEVGSASSYTDGVAAIAAADVKGVDVVA